MGGTILRAKSNREETKLISKSKIVATALLATTFLSARAEALCLFGCEPTAANARSVFENVVKKKFDPDAKVLNFDVTRFWRIDVEGYGHKSIEYYFKALVEFPKGANLDCKPEGDKVKEGCSASTFYSTTISNRMVKERQYIEPGAKIEFNDETRFDEDPKGWKGQDSNVY